jgi:hypothetical protein
VACPSGPAAFFPAHEATRPVDPVEHSDQPEGRDPYAYALIRVVPRVERGECVNAGVVLFCRPRRFLEARLELNRERLLALAPDLDLEAVAARLDLIARVCAGDPTAGAIAALPQAERFGWLVAPASTTVQPSEVHAGLCDDPAATLDHLFATMVRVPAGEPPP